MLTHNPKRRIKTIQILQHPWFAKFHSQNEFEEIQKLDPNVITKLKTYKGESFFKRAAMNILVKMSTDETQMR